MANALPGLPPSYQFDTKAGRYRNSRGHFVAFRTIYDLMGVLEETNADTLRNLSSALAEGQLPAPAWYMASAQQLMRLHVQYAALGAGGVDRLTPAHFATIDAVIRSELPRLLQFGVEIEGGSVSPAQAAARADMYIGTARKHYWANLPKPQITKDEAIVERRALGVAEHCAWCVYLANAGWQQIDTLPLPGESNDAWDDGQCLSNCRCTMQQQVVLASTLDSILGPPLPAEYQRK